MEEQREGLRTGTIECSNSNDALLTTPTRRLLVTPRRSPRLFAKASGNEDAQSSVQKEVAAETTETVAAETADAPPPAVGMVFNSFLEVEQFYKNYAKQQGFAISRTQGAYSARKDRRATTWRCECWGDPEMTSVQRSKRKAKEIEVSGTNVDDDCGAEVKKRSSKKCFCPALVYASVDENMWVIRKVVLEHEDHTPKPSMAILVKEYRMEHFTRSVRKKLINDSEVGVRVSQIHSALVNERGRYENMAVTEKDLRGELDKNKKLKMVGGDSNALVAYFDKMQQDNANFFHTHRLDEEGKMKDVLWADARSRAAYEEFSDVVCFDTTYLTNEYSLPFANFVGVNHHGQTILFGCALISHEDCDTFEWVFRKWLMCMNGKQPGGILTDQAAAMRKPLEEVMPDARHRWCIWHILQKLTSKVAQIEGIEEFKDELLDETYNSLNTMEFETGWSRVVMKYGVQENEWLTNLYVERHMWVPCFMNDYFWAGMRTTQRVESIHSFFDKFIGRHTMLCEFGEKYIAAVKKRANDEKTADSKSEKWVRNYATGYFAERFFRKLYTNNKFAQVQKECRKITHVDVIEEKEKQVDGCDGISFEYLIEDRVWVLPKGCAEEIVTTRRTYYRVWFYPQSEDAYCNCRMFETHGIMCRHLIRVFDRNRLQTIPPKFVLRRWRKDIERKHTSISVGVEDEAKTKRAKRLEKLSTMYEPVTDLAVRADKYLAIVKHSLVAIKAELSAAIQEDEAGKSRPTSESLGGSSSVSSLSDAITHRSINTSPRLNSACSETGAQTDVPHTPTSHQQTYDIKDPPIPKKLGRPRTTRFKSATESGSKKKKGSSKEKKGTNAKGQPGSCKHCKQSTPDVSQGPGCITGEGTSAQVEKMQVKRKKKSVSFTDIMPDPYPICTPDLAANDDLLHRNLLTYSPRRLA